MAVAEFDQPTGAARGPARPAKLSVDFFTAGDDVGFVDRRRGHGWAPVLFMLVWLIGWSAGCVMILREVVVKGELKMILFGIPFWTAWVVVASIILYWLFGRSYFALTSSGVYYIHRLFVPIRQRYIPLEEIKGFKEYSQKSGDKSNSTQYGIELESMGAPLRLAVGVTPVERQWLLYQFDHHLVLLRGETSAGAVSTRVPASVSKSRKKGPQTEVLQLSREPIQAPSDSAWQLQAGFALEFVRQGRFQPTALGVALCICLFWNGIVSVFLYALFFEQQPSGFEWWFLFLFLIPFEAVGLVLLAAVLLTILEPVSRSAWRFTDNAIEYRLRIGPFRRTWYYTVPRLERIEIRRSDSPTKNAVHAIAHHQQLNERPWSLCFIGRQDHVEIATIEGLTEGEARWMGQTVLRERQIWFR